MIRFMTHHRYQTSKITTNRPKATAFRVKQCSGIRCGSTWIGSSTRYVPDSLDEILTLEQCATWLQQPEPLLLAMIQAGNLKPLSFPGENYRLHARNLLLQLGVAGEALGQPMKPVDLSPDVVKDNTSVPGRFPGFHPGFTEGITPEISEDFTTPDKPSSRRAKLTNSSGRRSPATQPIKAIEKAFVICRSYHSHGRLIEVTQALGNSTRQQLAEATALDVVVNSLKSRLA
jgi:hypothetical protein